MDQFAYNKNLPKFKTANDPSLTLEIKSSREYGPVFDSGDNDPKLFAIFDAPEHTLNSANIFGNPDNYASFSDLAFQEPIIRKDDSGSYCAVTGSNTAIDDKDLLLTDFDNSSSSPNSQSSKNHKCNSIPATKSELECSLLDNLTFEQMITPGALAQSTPPPSGNLFYDCNIESVDQAARPLSRVTNSGFLVKTPTTQKKSPKKNYPGDHAFKIQKPRQFENTSNLQSLISSYNMELNYILRSEKNGRSTEGEVIKRNTGNSIDNNKTEIFAAPQTTSTTSNNSEYNSETPIQNVDCQILPPIALCSEGIAELIQNKSMNPLIVDDKVGASELDNTFNSGNESIYLGETAESFKAPKLNSGKLPRSRRMKCLKKDSTVSMEEKLEYFERIIHSAKINGLRGIFLRDHAAAELAINKNDYNALELDLTNFDLITQTLEVMMQTRSESFRTLWKIFRQQYDQQVFLSFQLSDEYATVKEGETEISIFTLMVPGHTPKHLMTGCQYLQLVNFILGKEYNHLINDNLAETTVGSDGKMISTQKHHASRVRSHVKKYLKRHVVKDIKRYTEDERRNSKEFNYQMTLHNIVMGCAVKKPFESKVSVALMELLNVKDALLKQADFFVFKKI
ncbi:(ZYRO0G21032g) [Zygosaccharomyces parabailii]|nr:(ZYRO0G21032g) [Zygosaccharomyces parabailii]CDH12525.1 uncharacterized protein ZBAI_04311 [Zygosaccharomyces bailii ISA1307]